MFESGPSEKLLCKSMSLYFDRVNIIRTVIEKERACA